MDPNLIDLTDLENVKLYANVASIDDDNLIQGAITAFSQYVLNFCGRDSLSAAEIYTEIIDGNGSERIFPRNAPIASITSLLVNGITVPLSTGYGVAGYFIEQTKRSIAIRTGAAAGFNQVFSTDTFPGIFLPFTFAKGIGNIQLIYTSGYIVNATNEKSIIAAGTIPALTFQSQWFSDQGINYSSNLVPLSKVASAPAQGQYAVSNGLYVFNAADNTAGIFVNYQYSATPPDLEFAVRQAVAINYNRKDYRDHASKSFSPSSGSSTTTYRDWKYPPEVAMVLQNYRRFAY